MCLVGAEVTILPMVDLLPPTSLHGAVVVSDKYCISTTGRTPSI